MITHKKVLELSSDTRVLYCRTKQEALFGCKLIQIKSLDEYAVWSVDCEWKISYKKGHVNPISLIQFGREKVVVLFHIVSCGLQQCIIDILLNPQIIKVGVNISGDVQKLQRDFGHLMGGEARGACDLRTLSRVTAIPPQMSLAGLVQSELGAILPKPHAIRCGDWGRIPLSHEQQKYAALDVYAGYLIFLRILGRWRTMREVEAPLRITSYPDGLANDCVYLMLCKNTCESYSFGVPSLPPVRSPDDTTHEIVAHDIAPSSCPKVTSFPSTVETMVSIASDATDCASASEKRSKKRDFADLVDTSDVPERVVGVSLHPSVRDILRALPDRSLPLPTALLSTVGVRRLETFQMWCSGKSVEAIAKVVNISQKSVQNHIITCIANGFSYRFSLFNISAEALDAIVCSAIDVYEANCFPKSAALLQSSTIIPPTANIIITEETPTVSYICLSGVRAHIEKTYDCPVPTIYDLKAASAHLSRSVGRNWLWKLIQMSRSKSFSECCEPEGSAGVSSVGGETAMASFDDYLA